MKRKRRFVVGSVMVLGVVVAAIGLASQFNSVDKLPLEKPVQARAFRVFGLGRDYHPATTYRDLVLALPQM